MRRQGKGSGLDTCVGTVANGHAIDTSTLGDHTFTVTATDQAGNVTTTVSHYSVRLPGRASSARSQTAPTRS